MNDETQEQLLPQPPRPPRRRAIRSNNLESTASSFIKCERLASTPLRVLQIAELGAKIQALETAASEVPSEELVDASFVMGSSLLFSVKIRIVYLRDQFLGIEFVQPSKRLRAAIRAFFEPEFLGSALEVLDENRDGTMRRLQLSAPNTCSVEVLIQKDVVESFSITSRPYRFVFKAYPGHGIRDEKRTAMIRLVRNIACLGDTEKAAITEFLVDRAGLQPMHLH